MNSHIAHALNHKEVIKIADKEKKPKKEKPKKEKKQVDQFKCLEEKIKEESSKPDEFIYNLRSDHGDKMTRIFTEQQDFRVKTYYNLENLFAGIEDLEFKCVGRRLSDKVSGDDYHLSFKSDRGDVISRVFKTNPINFKLGEYVPFGDVLPKISPQQNLDKVVQPE